MNQPLALRRRDDTVVLLDLPPRVLADIGLEAAYRGLSIERMVSRLLANIAESNMFPLILDGDWHG